MPGLCPASTRGQVTLSCVPTLRDTKREPQRHAPAAAKGFVLRGRDRLETDAGEAARAGTDPARLYRNAVSSARHRLKSSIGKDDIQAWQRCSLGGCSPIPPPKNHPEATGTASGLGKAAVSCGSALVQGTLHMLWAGDVRTGTLQGLSQPAKGRAEGAGKRLERSRAAMLQKHSWGGTESTLADTAGTHRLQDSHPPAPHCHLLHMSGDRHPPPS